MANIVDKYEKTSQNFVEKKFTSAEEMAVFIETSLHKKLFSIASILVPSGIKNNRVCQELKKIEIVHHSNAFQDTEQIIVVQFESKIKRPNIAIVGGGPSEMMMPFNYTQIFTKYEYEKYLRIFINSLNFRATIQIDQ